ncbi:MAG: undecaprenyldiphospho-muramoylpentapeptide beta-N-acetylglucosaminyltransferase [Burkholderiaceae bacterium]|nr:undecaprenyldiphospho-muramoylpentapeptide beta-N-acetylglucosaminyltransferase [Burkholderiaceae bacterium]
MSLPARSQGEPPGAQREGALLRHLMVVAAGTGGHVMPGLAVAEALRARGWSVSWLGTRAGLERQWVEPRGIAFDAIDFSSLRGKGMKTLLFGGFHLLRALWQSRALVRARKPRAMFSTGGYVAVPAGMAASTLGVPLIVLNSDAAPLMSNSMLRPLASAVLCGFDGVAAQRAGAKGEVTGNPVRAEISQIRSPEHRFAGRAGPLQLLVIGGSLGARVLNENVPRALALIAADQRPVVVHQCGAAHVESVRAQYQALGVHAEVVAFIDDMPTRYALADVVVCRAGAITISELAVAGVASVLVPLIVSTTSHQRDNAEYMAAHDAAIHLPQAGLTAQVLADLLRDLTRARLLLIAQAARSIGRPDATERVAAAIERVAA